MRKNNRLHSSRRRGSAFILMLALLGVFVFVAALTIDFSYMQMVRSEMRAAVDAAAKAGAESLARTENVDQATNAAITVAAANKVAGKPFLISSSDVVFGKVSPDGANKWNFTANQSPFNAVKINARTGSGATNSEIPLFFGHIFGKTSFTPSFSSTAGQQEVDVCLCLDRSGSMLFDMSGTEYEYPSNNPNLSSFTAWGTVWRNHLSPPHPTASRWAILRNSVDCFLNEAEKFNPQPRISMVTWSSDYTMPIAPSTVFSAATTDLSLSPINSANWNTNKGSVQSKISSLGAQPMMGGTNLSAGLDRAVAVLNGSNASAYKNKVVILMTDGEWNAGRDPYFAALDARSSKVTVHCVSLLTANQPTLQSIAQVTGGKYLTASNAEELEEAFIELARSLPVVLTD
jgi:hypothetical protein